MNSNAYLNLAASLSDYEATNTERPNSNLNVDDALSVLHSQKWQIEAECVDSIINYVRTAHQRDITAKFSISELVTVATSHA